MKIISLFVVTFLILLPPSGTSQDLPPTEREIKNLTAFTKIFGYTKYFHPSDEARQIHWDQFAILGTEKVLKAKSDEELIEILESLFLPIAPTVAINSAKPDSHNFRQNYLNLINRDTTGLKKVVWQHQGVNMSFSQYSAYQSLRTNRNDKAIDSNFRLFQSFDAEGFINQTARLNAMIINKSADQNGFAELVISIYDKNGALISRENYIVPADADGNWDMHELDTTVPENAARISAGVRLNGEGEIWVDDLIFLVQGSDTELSLITNGNFEQENYGRPVGWSSAATGNYDFRIDQEESFYGDNSFYIADSEPQLPDQLFEQMSKLGEVVVEEVVNGVWIKIPLSLLSDNHSTLPEADEKLFNALREELDRIDLDRVSANNQIIRLANIIIAWNELQHFFPYFDDIETDWNRQLTESLISAYRDRSAEEFFITLSKLVASLEDGHGRVSFPPMDSKVGFPFIVDWIDDQVVVTHSQHDQILPGDIVHTVDQVTAEEIVDSQQQLLSGSHHYTLFHALRKFAYGNEGTTAEIQIERNGETRALHISRTGSVDYTRMEKGDRILIGPLDEDIFYVDLDEAPIDTIMSRIEEIRTAEAVIFDLRGYPASNHNVISHLLSEPDTSDSWIRIPQFIYPDQKGAIGFENQGWQIPVEDPKIEGKSLFIIDARAISYAESYMSFIEHYQLAEIVGQPTAGANGSINFFNLPGNFRVTWTGMKVVKHDGSQLYKIGIEPTVQVDKTIEGVRQGRDEFLERAIEIARGK